MAAPSSNVPQKLAIVMAKAKVRFVRIADLTTATSACALMGMPRVLLSYLLIYQAAP
jgi:hypothetical protein